MLFTIIALIVILSYMSYKLYAWDLKNEFTGFGELLKNWVGCFSKAELGQEVKLLGYELWESIKGFITPIKTLGLILGVVVAPVLFFVLNILLAIIKVHKRK